MALKTFVKDPDADKDYGVDWSGWLATGESIQTSTWLSTPSGLTLHDDAIVGAVPKTYVSGGAVGVVYTVTNRITTDANPARTDDRSFLLKIEHQ